MATYPNVNAANQYARDIVGGKILACQLTILACQRHLDDLERAKDPHWPYRFDKNKAERFLRFAQKMPHTSGEWARRKLRIEFEAWQKFALGVPFGWVHKKTGLRRFSEIYIEVPRKNGKSAIAAAVGNYMFCADGEHGAEVYCGATTEKQAWKVFSPALQMVKKLPALRQKFSIKPWAKKMTRPDGSVFAPVIGDPGDGDSPSCAIIDEYHEHTTDALYTTMTTGNRNNATAVPVMVAEGNELYIDTARIKNSSLTSTKIADGSITNAKIGNEIRSNDFVDGSRGWRIAKDGSSQFNNVIVRGAVYATDGWFQGTVYANHIEGDIGSFAINIAQHRTRKVPKATWQWFELARFRRQNFDQVINIRGGLLQTDSITIDGGAKLRAGMSYAPGADGGLNPGYLSYAMLLRGTGATSGGGSMELGIELMYETGGATRLLTAQESMNVDNMSFVVPAGTGDAVLRYGCYLDRNGQMVLTILSRFDAFAARNNNVIRGSST
ncbi:TPA: terminase large subunit domain-containing protein [Klebsiella variicola subsp. variicola]